MNQHFKETPYGFEWGAARIQRAFSDVKRGWVTLTLETPKHEGGDNLQIYVTKTGKVRIHDARGEWQPPAEHRCGVTALAQDCDNGTVTGDCQEMRNA